MAQQEWTRARKLAALMRLPWTVTTERNADEDYLVARVAELPSVIATGATERELARDLWESLEASLVVYLDYDDTIPLPAEQVLPWERHDEARPRIVYGQVRGDAWSVSAASVGRTVVIGG
jgi:predicted RNase H-like HicB family nuclease